MELSSKISTCGKLQEALAISLRGRESLPRWQGQLLLQPGGKAGESNFAVEGVKGGNSEKGKGGKGGKGKGTDREEREKAQVS